MGAIQSIQRSGSATSSRKQGLKVWYDPRSRSNLGELRLLGDRGGANLRNRRNVREKNSFKKSFVANYSDDERAEDGDGDDGDGEGPLFLSPRR